MQCCCYCYLGPFLWVQEDAQGRNGVLLLNSCCWDLGGAAGEQSDHKVLLLDAVAHLPTAYAD